MSAIVSQSCGISKIVSFGQSMSASLKITLIMFSEYEKFRLVETEKFWKIYSISLVPINMWLSIGAWNHEICLFYFTSLCHTVWRNALRESTSRITSNWHPISSLCVYIFQHITREIHATSPENGNQLMLKIRRGKLNEFPKEIPLKKDSIRSSSYPLRYCHSGFR